MKSEKNGYKLSGKINCLVLCTTQKEDKPRAPSLETGTPDKLNNEPTLEELEPGYLLRVKAKILYKVFSTHQPFLWQREIIEWCKNFLAINQIKKIKIMTENLDAIKLFYKQLTDIRKTRNFTLILSDESHDFLSKHDPSYLKKIKPHIINEKESLLNKIKTEQSNKIIAERVIGISKNTAITPLERKLYLLLLGRNLKGVNCNEIEYLIFYYDTIANELTGCLGCSKKDIFKALDCLIKKSLIYIIKEHSVPFFMIGDNGPVDLL